MIDKLILKNFQGHKSSELEFCPGVNAIVGESDEGKTSIIRALYWASQNKPSGGDFISDFSKKGECTSTIVVDGNSVKRELEFHTDKKGNKVIDSNAYRVNKQEFKALGKGGVPDEVKNILQLPELNFQNQMDSPFLLSANGGEVARYLNEVADLNIISESLTKAKSKVDGLNREIKTTESDVETSKTELSELDWIESAEKEFRELEFDNHDFKLLEQVNSELADHLNDIDDLLEELEKYKDHDQELYAICLLIDEYKNYQAQSDYLDSFKSDLNAIELISDKIDSLPLDKKEIESISVLQGLIDDYQIEKNHLNEFNGLVVLGINLEDKKEVCIESIQTLETEFKNEFPDECPLCGATG